jgi:hypothetical protein
MSIENQNLYSEEEAIKEANEMKDKINSGEAKSYNEAEKLIDQENLKQPPEELPKKEEPRNRWDLISKELKKEKEGYQKEFAKLSPDEQQEAIDKLKKEREKIEQEIKELYENLDLTIKSDAASDRIYSPEQEELKEKIENKNIKLGEITKKVDSYEEYLNKQSSTKEQFQTPKQGSEETPETQSPEKQSEKKEEKSEGQKETIQNQIKDLVADAEKILYSKEYSDEDKTEALKNYSEKISSLLGIPASSIYLTELIKDNKKLDLLVNSISKIKDEEKKIDKPKVIQQATELIKKEENKGKESIFQKMGGWNTVGGVAGFSLMMFLILAFLGEFWVLGKATGIDLESEGGKKGKK